MINTLKYLLKLIILTVLFTACAGETTHEIKELGLSVTLPAGWEAGQDTYGGVLTVEFSKDNKRMLSLSEAEPTVDNLDMLVKASKQAGYEVLKEEKIDKGFGVQLKIDGKKQFAYYINKNNIQYRFEPGPYYEEDGFEGCISIIKSAK